MKDNTRVLAIVGAALLVVALLFGVSIAIGGGDDDSDDASGADRSEVTDVPADTDGGEDAADDEEIAQTRPVTVEGEPLPPYGETNDPAVGEPAPVVLGENYDGEAVTIGEATGSPQMYVFLAHWCPHCNDEIPELLAVDDEGGVPDDLRVVGISTAVDPSGPNYPPSEWLVEKGWRWESMADSVEADTLATYGASSFPFTVLVDGDGNVIARKAGSSSADEIAGWLATNSG